MARADLLAVWMNGQRVGTWTQARGGAASFQYESAWIDSPAARVLSLSLPFNPGNTPHRGAVVTSYFDNLLPDSDAIRSRLQHKFATGSGSAFDLLTAIGRDCVGAVQLLPEGESPKGFDRIEAEPLDDAGVERTIGASLSAERALGQDEDGDLRFSLAGAQEKITLLRQRNRWYRPRGATPSTHILKLPLGLVGNLQADMRESVENEWLCLQLLQAFGLETAQGEIARFGDRKVLVVERFDRAWQKSRWVARLPQEDFCQALGQPPRLKYEADGGPGMSEILRILMTSSHAEADIRAFIKTQILFFLLAATDGHAKNFSLFHERGGTYRLTPLYDVLSAWPIIGPGSTQIPWQKARLAMSVRSRNVHWKLKEIQPRHWDAVARSAGLGDATALLTEIASAAPTAIEKVNRALPKNFPSKIADKILQGVKTQATAISDHLNKS